MKDEPLKKQRIMTFDNIGDVAVSSIIAGVFVLLLYGAVKGTPHRNGDQKQNT